MSDMNSSVLSEIRAISSGSLAMVGCEPTCPAVSVVIVNYNGLKFLNHCINSLHTALVNHAFEIIIVDNASTDGSREWLRQRNDIVYVQSEENLGFTGGNNLGASHARADRLLFINNDTFANTTLDYLVDLLDDPTIGIAACRLIYADQRQQFSSVMTIPLCESSFHGWVLKNDIVYLVCFAVLRPTQ